MEMERSTKFLLIDYNDEKKNYCRNKIKIKKDIEIIQKYLTHFHIFYIYLYVKKTRD